MTAPEPTEAPSETVDLADIPACPWCSRKLTANPCPYCGTAVPEVALPGPVHGPSKHQRGQAGHTFEGEGGVELFQPVYRMVRP